MQTILRCFFTLFLLVASVILNGQTGSRLKMKIEALKGQTSDGLGKGGLLLLDDAQFK